MGVTHRGASPTENVSLHEYNVSTGGIMRLNIKDIATACNGQIIGQKEEIYINWISTDSRSIKPLVAELPEAPERFYSITEGILPRIRDVEGSITCAEGTLFVPIVGERFDGHDYIQMAAQNEAVCALSEKEIDVGIPLILVKSTRRALMDLAGYYRRLFDIKVVAITGSAGKTTTKDMIYHVLSRKYKTKKTIGNFNNDIGLPLSIFQLEPSDEALVLEMGMNHAGEIHELSLTGAPDIAVITHIGDAHIENFENRTGILHAKLEIVDGLAPNGVVVLNGDDPLLTSEIANEKVKPFNKKVATPFCESNFLANENNNVLYPSSKNILKAEPMGLQKTCCRFNWKGQEINITVPVPGAHMVMNAFLAVAVGVEMGISPNEITLGFEDFAPPEGRLSVETANDMVIINDVYNANPAAMKEAIKVLHSPETAKHTRRVAILGDMNELGHVAKERHFEVGEFANESGVDLLVAIGELSKHIYDGFNNPEKSLYFKTVDEFLSQLKEVLFPGDIILVKASRGMTFENIVNTILKE